MPGFEGLACQRGSYLKYFDYFLVQCKNNCNGHGTCMTIENLYNYFTWDSTLGLYDSWDADHLTTCVCDIGYTGPSCAMRMCPKGDDPFTNSVDYRTIEITTSSTSSLDGYFQFIFNGEYFYFPANANDWTASSCESDIESLSNIKDVECSRSSVGTYNDATYTVQLMSFPVFPYENNIYHHDGNPSLSKFHCSTEKVTSGTDVTCNISNVIVDTIPGMKISFNSLMYCRV